MKKFFTLCACIVAVITASAQGFTQVTEFEKHPYPMHKRFTYNEKPLMFSYNTDYENNINEFHIYDYDFNLVKTHKIQGELLDWVEFEDYDTSTTYSINTVITQTLFNDDEKFEFLLYYNDEMNIGVCSEDGTMLYTLPDEITGTSVQSIVGINGKNYIIVRIYHPYSDEPFDGYNTYRFYLIDKQTTSIKKVAEIKGSFINIANGSVKITLKNESNGNSEVAITTTKGQLAKLVEIPNGVKSIEIETTGMQRGIYNFTIVEEGKIIETGKIAVR